MKWKQCPDCDYKSKEIGNLNAHIKRKHYIGVQWKQCPDCDFKAKTNGNLNQHIKSMLTSK